MVLHKYHNFLYMDKLNSILAVGSIALDSIETPNGKKNNILGGSATHFSLAASFFTNVKIVGVVGNDFPNKAWKLFESKKINLDNLTISNGKTFRWGGRYNNDYSKRDTIFTHLGVFEHFVPKINSTDLNSKFILDLSGLTSVYGASQANFTLLVPSDYTIRHIPKSVFENFFHM